MPAIAAFEGLDDTRRAVVLDYVAQRTDRLGHDVLGEEKRIGLGSGVGVIDLLATEGNELIGYAQLRWGGGHVTVEYVGDDPKTDEALLSQAVEEVGERGGAMVHLWRLRPADGDEAVPTALGFHLGRELYELERPLPLDAETAASPRVETRAFRPGIDEPAFLGVNAAAFTGHPEQGAWDLPTLLARERQAWFSADDLRCYDEDGSLAGFCWTKITPPDGEIYVIAVSPAFQGKGLGRAILLSGLDHMVSLGLERATLYVDGDNTAAMSLYRSLGFSTAHVDRAYVREVHGE
jgi:mycothiol synthase